MISLLLLKIIANVLEKAEYFENLVNYELYLRSQQDALHSQCNATYPVTKAPP